MAVDKLTVESLPFTHPLFLHPSDTQEPTIVRHVLTGVDNYTVWSRAMKNALQGKHKLGFIDGTCQKASQESGLQDQWERCNAVVLSWIINSISKELANGVNSFQYAHDAWNDLKKRFDKKTGSRIFSLYCEISSYRQGSSSVTTYFSKLEELWEEQSALLAIPTCGCDSSKAHAKLSEQQKLFQFLMGLNDSYGQARSQILLIMPLPSVNEAYAMIIQDETQKSIAVKKDTEPTVHALTATGPLGWEDPATRGLYMFRIVSQWNTVLLLRIAVMLKASLWHRRLGHAPAFVAFVMRHVNDVPTDFPTVMNKSCDVCVQAKQTKYPLTVTETVNHPRHCHPLRLKGDEGNPFECSGCKDLGFGPRYQCEENDCSFVLHEDCFKARDTDPSKTHPFMGNCRFQFLWEPPGGPGYRICDACGMDVQGFLYHGKAEQELDLHACCMNLESTMCDLYHGKAEQGLDLHPCCMNLESTMCDPSGTMKLILKDNAPSKCVKCEEKEPLKGLSYVSSCGNYSYHVYCVKKMIIDNWGRGYFNVASSSSTSLRGRSMSRDNTASSSRRSRSSEQIYISSMTASTSTSLALARRPSTPSFTGWLIKIAKIGFSVIISVLFGNPTPLFTALAEDLLD